MIRMRNSIRHKRVKCFTVNDCIFRRRILQITDGIDNPGGLVGQLSLSLFIVWFLVYLCVWRGIGWMGKVSPLFDSLR